MPRPTGYVCRDFGRLGCCSIPDERYTMRFDDIGEPPIYWCTHCGKEAAAMDAAINNALATRPGFAEDFKKAIEEAEANRKDEQ